MESLQAMGEPDAVREMFRARGIRCTKQRVMIFGELCARCDHPTADELFRRVRHLDEGLSLATVYNTLEVLTEAGLINRLPPATAAGASRYDADHDGHMHARLDDGALVDIPHDLGQQLLASLPAEVMAALEARLGVKVKRVKIELDASRVG